MAGRVLELAQKAPSGRVLLVVGSAHVPGLLYALHHPGCKALRDEVLSGAGGGGEGEPLTRRRWGLRFRV
jgi:hypothetical protein